MGAPGIELLRDEWGIPHVFAESRLDAFFAQGFVHGIDRLWQLVLDRRKAAGRSAELIGRKGVVADVFVRRMGLVAAAAGDLELLAPDERAVFDAYADGVNAAIATGDRPRELELLGHEPEPWTALDSLAVWKVRHVFMGSKAMKLWRSRLVRALGSEAMTRLASADGRDELLIVPPDGHERWHADAGEIQAAAEAWAAEGSNSWALDGSRTASGAPIIAGDPHRLLEVPSVYVQMQLACDAFDVIGLAIPGIPGFPHFGHNGRVAWAITHAMADDQDLYRERFDADGRVRDVDGWSEPTRRTERIEIADGDAIDIDVVTTRRGAIVFGDPSEGEALSLRWTGSDEPRRGLACLASMLEAATAEAMDAAMAEWVVPCNSMLIGDRDGIRYLHRGRVPIRHHANGWLPVPAWDERVAWRGDVPFDELPRIVRPEAGRIVTANNRVVGATYPYRLATDYAAPNRARRITERLDALGPASVEDMAAIHADAVSLAGRVFLDALAEIGRPDEPFAAEAFDLVAGFDAEMRAGSVAATMLHQTRHVFLDLLVHGPPLDALAENPFREEPFAVPPQARLRSALQRLLTPKAPSWLDDAVLGDRNRIDLLREAFERAVERLRERFGDDLRRWTYERIHRTEIRHPLSDRFPEEGLDPPSVPLDGDGDTVCVSADEIGYGIYHASVARYVFDLADREASGWIVPLGSAGDPRSPHRTNQQERWARCELIPVSGDRERLREVAAERQTLERPG